MKFFCTLSKVAGVGVTPDALTALFGVWSSTLNLSPAKKDLIAFSALLKRRQILLKWKSPVPPNYTGWVRDVLYFLKLWNKKIKEKRNSLTLSGKVALFPKTWNPFLSYINNSRCQITVLFCRLHNTLFTDSLG